MSCYGSFAFTYSTSNYNTAIAIAMLQGTVFGNETLWQPTLAFASCIACEIRHLQIFEEQAQKL